jgi:hypothetical protein
MDREIRRKQFLVTGFVQWQAVAWYVPGNEMGYAAAGFSRNEGLTFIANQQGKMKFIRAELK